MLRSFLFSPSAALRGPALQCEWSRRFFLHSAPFPAVCHIGPLGFLFSQRAPVGSCDLLLLRSPRYSRAAYTAAPSYHRLQWVPEEARGIFDVEFPRLHDAYLTEASLPCTMQLRTAARQPMYAISAADNELKGFAAVPSHRFALPLSFPSSGSQRNGCHLERCNVQGPRKFNLGRRCSALRGIS